MTSTRPDLRALRRSDPSPLNQPLSAPAAHGRVPVPRPKSRWRTRVLVPLAVLLTTGGVLAYAARDVLRPAIDVRVAPVVPKAGGSITPGQAAAAAGSGEHDRNAGPGAVLVQAPGWIEPAPYAISVPALAEGVVQDILVLEGERVEAGQVVARMIDTDARLQLRLTESAVAQRTADVERAKTSLATSETQIAIEQANVSEIEEDIDRKRALVGSGVSAGDFRRMEIRLGGVKAKTDAAKQLVDEAKAAVRQAESAVTAAIVNRDEASLRLERMEIRSSSAGVVLARLVEPGTRISLNSNDAGGNALMGVVLRLYDPEKLQVRVDVPLADAAKVVVGARAQITTEAMPDKTFEGVVTRAMHEANIQRNTVQFKVSIEHPSTVLKPEMLARVKLYSVPAQGGSEAHTTATRSPSSSGFALLIPTAALINPLENEASIWVVDASSGSAVARKREVTTQPSVEQGFVEILDGLRAGDRVIVAPPAQLHEGSRIKVLGEQMSGPPATKANQSIGGAQ